MRQRNQTKEPVANLLLDSAFSRSHAPSVIEYCIQVPHNAILASLLPAIFSWFKAEFPARFNAGRFRVTTEAKLRPLARFGCSMVWRLISACRAVHQLAEAGASTNCDVKDCRIRQSNQQRIVSVILPVCVHLRNLRTRNLRMIDPDRQLAQDRAWRCAPTDYLSGLLPPGLFSAHLTVPGGVRAPLT